MRQHDDEAAYAAGQRAVIDADEGFDFEAMQRAHAYVVSRSLEGAEEAVRVLLSFVAGVYDARAAQEGHD